MIESARQEYLLKRSYDWTKLSLRNENVLRVLDISDIIVVGYYYPCWEAQRNRFGWVYALDVSAQLSLLCLALHNKKIETTPLGPIDPVAVFEKDPLAYDSGRSYISFFAKKASSFVLSEFGNGRPRGLD